VTIDAPHPLDFFAKLCWLDGRPLPDTIEPYRRAIFESVLYTFDEDRLQYNLAVCGRAKKNWKTCDLILAALYRLMVWPSPQGICSSARSRPSCCPTAGNRASLP
jgi:hypothetical protein